jgi:hypothetical protein
MSYWQVLTVKSSKSMERSQSSVRMESNECLKHDYSLSKMVPEVQL